MNACDTSSGQNPDGSKVLVAFANATDKTVSVTVPVGEAALGRILNVLGNPVDNGPPIPDNVERWPIHRPSPDFADLEPKTEIFETGIKVVDL